MLQVTYNLVKECGMLHAAIFTADINRITALQEIDPTVIVSVSGMTSVALINGAYKNISMSRCANISIPAANLTEELIMAGHNIGAFVKMWYYQGSSADNVSNIRAAFDFGCDFAITGKVTPSDL